MGTRAGLDKCGKSRPHRDSIPDRPARRYVTIPTELPGPHNLKVLSNKNKTHFVFIKGFFFSQEVMKLGRTGIWQ